MSIAIPGLICLAVGFALGQHYENLPNYPGRRRRR